jgi:hypothetical protein
MQSDKELTPMQKGINELQKRIYNWEKYPCQNDNQTLANDYHIKGLQEAIQVLTILLPKERTMVEDAYLAAQIEMVKSVADSLSIELPKTKDELNKILNGEDNEDAFDYFTNKYISNE